MRIERPEMEVNLYLARRENEELKAKLAAVERERNELRGKLSGAEKCIQFQERHIDDATAMRESAETMQKMAERDRDAERAHNAVLRLALYRVRDEIANYGSQSDLAMLLESAKQSLSATPSDSAAKVQKLVDALEVMVDVIDDQLGGGGYVPEFDADINEKFEPWASIFDAQEKAQKALAEWRNEA